MSRIITPPAYLSFPNIFVPRQPSEKDAAKGKKPKYQAALVFLASDDPAYNEEIKKMKMTAINVAKAKWGDKLAGMELKALDGEHGLANFLVSDQIRVRLPWRDAPSVLAKKGYPEGALFFNASTLHKPQVVTQIAGPDGKPTVLSDESLLRAGCLVKASVDAYAYSGESNGVTFGLGNIQYIGAGDASVIGATAGVAAVDEFSADASAVADLGDVDGVDSDVDDGLNDLLG